MTITNLARVTIHRIRVTDAHSVVGEPGDEAEWNVVFMINFAMKVKYYDVPLSAGTVSIGADFDVGFTVITPLIDGEVVIRVFGDEIDDTTPNDKLTPLQRIHRPADEFPLGASWLRADVSDLGGGSGGFFPYEKGTETLGGYTIWYSIEPYVERAIDDRRTYYPLLRPGKRYNGWQVTNWEDFTSKQDEWFAEGLRLKRVATHLNDASTPRFAETANRGFMGVYQEGGGRWDFWLMDEPNFMNKYNELRKQRIRCDDIFCYRENDYLMIGGTFSGDGPQTEIFTDMTARDLKVKNDEQKRLGRSMISLDTYHNGKDRRFMAVFEDQAYDTELVQDVDYGDLMRARQDLRERGLYIEDYCIHNDGGKAVFNVIFHPADPMQDYMTEDKGFAYLESRIEYNYNRDYHVANLDSWSPTDPE